MNSSDIFVHARTAFNKADWLHLVLSPTVAVGGVKECGIFMNEITTEAGAPESLLIGRPGQNHPSSS